MLRLVCASALALAFAACGPAVDIRGELSPEGGEVFDPLQRTDAGVRPRADAGPRPDTCPEPTLESIREKLFVTTCGKSNCHVAPNAPQELDLTLPVERLGPRLRETSKESASRLPLIRPGSYGASYLYLKVFLETPGEGEQMPPQAPLDDCTLTALRDWIQSGAN